jgi:hypothetical protein
MLLLEAFAHDRAMTRKKLLQTVHETDNPMLTKDRAHSFVGRHLHAIQLCHSLPSEDGCMTVPRAYLEQHITPMKDHIVEQFSDLVFNFDDVESSEREDRKRERLSRRTLFHRTIFPILLHVNITR